MNRQVSVEARGRTEVNDETKKRHLLPSRNSSRLEIQLLLISNLQHRLLVLKSSATCYFKHRVLLILLSRIFPSGISLSGILICKVSLSWISLSEILFSRTLLSVVSLSWISISCISLSRITQSWIVLSGKYFLYDKLESVISNLIVRKQKQICRKYGGKPVLSHFCSRWKKINSLENEDT